MNILSISQVQTQNPQTGFETLPIQNQKTADYEKGRTFSDFLRDAQKAEEKVQSDNTKTVSEDNFAKSEEIAKKDEHSLSKNDSNDSAEKSETKLSEDRKKSLAKNDSEDEKNGENVKKASEKNPSDGEFILAGLNGFNSDNNLSDFSENIDLEERKITLGDVDSEIDDKTLSWLLSSAKFDESEEISNDDFSALIDAASEFIPGSESEDEKLASAQNLSSSDPKMFLDVVAAENALNQARGAVKSEHDLNSDKKIASNTEINEKKKGARLSVHDLRTKYLFEDNSAKVDSSKIVQKAAEKKEISLSMQQQNENNVQMTMELAAKAQENITASSAQVAGASGSDFQAMLSNAVQENAPDFVKAGNIVLKDSNQGTINLILRPEGLGNVKISLNLDDKNLSAQITVQTKEAMDAFRESISSLKQAFTESGFETGSFDLNFSNNQDQQGFAQSGGQGQNQQNIGILAQKSYGEFVTTDALASGEGAITSSDGSYAINIVA